MKQIYRWSDDVVLEITETEPGVTYTVAVCDEEAQRRAQKQAELEAVEARAEQLRQELR